MSKYIIDGSKFPFDIKEIVLRGKDASDCIYSWKLEMDDVEELNSDYINDYYGDLQDEAYAKGLEDAWNAAEWIANASVDDLEKSGITRAIGLDKAEPRVSINIFGAMLAQDAIKIIKLYKQGNVVRVGDEVISSDDGCKIVVIEIGGLFVTGLDYSGRIQTLAKKEIVRTGRHFEEVASLFKKMRGE